MKNPEMIVKQDEKCVVIKDSYPKSKHHYLVLPKSDISSLRVVNATHLDLLRHILKVGKVLAEEIKGKESAKSSLFRFGYHALPSMTRLHMHVISQDFVSPCLKNKKHWNSFTTEFFLDAEGVIKELEDNGNINIDKEKYELLLKQALKCHVCGKSLSNMPQLKSHIASHI